MGHKVHPVGFRIGVIRDWQAKWYSDKHYAAFLFEDMKLRKAIQSRYADAAVSLVEIQRQANQVSVVIHTARPGIVIGRGGQRVDETRRYLEGVIGKKVQLDIREIQQPELDAYLVARTIAEQMERRIAYRRAMKQVMLRSIQAGAKGVKISCAGRLGGAEIARRLNMHEGQVPLHTLRADIDYGFTEARTAMGRIGVKAWIYKGEIFPEPKAEKVAEAVAEAGAEAAPVAEAVEKPAARRKAVAAALAAEAEAAPVATVAGVSAEAAPVVESAEKPVKPAVRRRKAVPAAETAVEVSAEAAPVVESAGKPVKPAVRGRKAVPAAKPAKEVSAEAAPVVESTEKPVKPAVRRKKAVPAAETAVEASAEAKPAAEKKPGKPAARKSKDTSTETAGSEEKKPAAKSRAKIKSTKEQGEKDVTA